MIIPLDQFYLMGKLFVERLRSMISFQEFPRKFMVSVEITLYNKIKA